MTDDVTGEIRRRQRLQHPENTTTEADSPVVAGPSGSQSRRQPEGQTSRSSPPVASSPSSLPMRSRPSTPTQSRTSGKAAREAQSLHRGAIARAQVEAESSRQGALRGQTSPSSGQESLLRPQSVSGRESSSRQGPLSGEEASSEQEESDEEEESGDEQGQAPSQHERTASIDPEELEKQLFGPDPTYNENRIHGRSSGSPSSNDSARRPPAPKIPSSCRPLGTQSQPQRYPAYPALPVSIQVWHDEV